MLLTKKTKENFPEHQREKQYRLNYNQQSDASRRKNWDISEDESASYHNIIKFSINLDKTLHTENIFPNHDT
jgi:hypothetical protein